LKVRQPLKEPVLILGGKVYVKSIFISKVASKDGTF